MDVHVERCSEEERRAWRTTFRVRIDLGEGLTGRQRAILYNSARKCEVYKLLSGEVDITYACQGQ